MAGCHVFLIPGFFGFSNLGELLYFAHVREVLTDALAERGLEVEVHRVATHPTASLPRRAVALLEAIRASSAAASGQIVLVGHSSGGLDARLLVSPSVALPTVHPVEPVARRVRAVVGIAAPHHGAPLATVFSTLFGQQLLRVLSLATIYIMQFGRLPLSVLVEIGGLFLRLNDRIGLTHTLVEQIYGQLLGDFGDKTQQQLERFFEMTAIDQTLMVQLRPEGAELLNAAAADRDSVRYGSVVTQVPRPGVRSIYRVGLSPYDQTTHALFQALHRGSRLAAVNYPSITPEQATALRRSFGRHPGPGNSDGIVPTLSQVWGEVIHATVADHLDVIGHFAGPAHAPPHYDWLTSGSHFDRRRFEEIWDAVADFVVSSVALRDR